MKEIKVVATCDRCGGSDADEYTEQNSKGKPVVLDLDKKCHDEFEELRRQAALILAPIAELADLRGIRPEKLAKPAKAAKAAKQPPPSERPGDRVCLVCPETRTSNSGILNHMTDAHRFPHSSPEIFGNVCPIDGEVQKGLLSRHVGQVHKEFVHISQAFAWAQKNGDPHQVVASRIAELEKAAKAA